MSITLRLGDMLVKHNYRDMNKVANLMANEGAEKNLFGRTTVLLVFANEAFRADILGIVFPRNILDYNINMLDPNSGINLSINCKHKLFRFYLSSCSSSQIVPDSSL